MCEVCVKVDTILYGCVGVLHAFKLQARGFSLHKKPHVHVCILVSLLFFSYCQMPCLHLFFFFFFSLLTSSSPTVSQDLFLPSSFSSFSPSTLISHLFPAENPATGPNLGLRPTI